MIGRFCGGKVTIQEEKISDFNKMLIFATQQGKNGSFKIKEDLAI